VLNGENMQRFCGFQSVLGVASAVLLTACGGGSSSPPPPPATHFSVAAPASVNAGTAFNLTVTALDASNNVVTGYSGTVHFTSTDAQAMLPANSALTNGAATLSATLKSAGGQTITGTDTAAPSITGTSSAIKIPAATSRFQNAGSMGTARLYHTATLLPDGAVLIAGGMNGTVAISSTEVFDPASGSFTRSGDMHTARQWHTATLLNNGKVLIAGGGDITSPSLSTAELFTPSTGAFTVTGSMKLARSQHTATLLPSGKVLVSGGWDASGNVLLNTAELFDPSTGTFATTGTMLYARASHNATLLGDGKVLITGGQQAELFDPLTQTFAATGIVCCYIPRQEGTATWLSESSVLIMEFVYGPIRGQRQPPIGFAQLYDSNSGTFAFTGGPFTGAGRWRHTATLRNDGKVLVAGGALVTLSQEGQPPVVTANAELFDPVGGTFVPTNDMVFAREYHTATLLNNGDVLISGGRDASGNTLTAAELYH
jgi:Galactose oxidase, central domain